MLYTGKIWCFSIRTYFLLQKIFEKFSITKKNYVLCFSNILKANFNMIAKLG